MRTGDDGARDSGATAYLRTLVIGMAVAAGATGSAFAGDRVAAIWEMLGGEHEVADVATQVEALYRSFWNKEGTAEEVAELFALLESRPDGERIATLDGYDLLDHVVSPYPSWGMGVSGVHSLAFTGRWQEADLLAKRCWRRYRGAWPESEIYFLSQRGMIALHEFRFDDAMRFVDEMWRCFAEAQSGISDPDRAELEIRLLESELAMKLGQLDRAARSVAAEAALIARNDKRWREIKLRHWLNHSELSLDRERYSKCVDVIDDALANQWIEEASLTQTQLLLCKSRALLGLLRQRPEVEASVREVLELISGWAAENPSSAEVTTFHLLWLDLELHVGGFAEAKVWASRLERVLARSHADPDALVRDRAQFETMRCELLRRTDAPQNDLRAGYERLRSSYRDLLRSWDRIPLQPGGVGFLFYESRRSALSELIHMALKVEPVDEGERVALGYLLEAHQRSSLVRRDPSRGASALEEVQASLCRVGSGVLAYLPSSDGTHLFAMDGLGVRRWTVSRMGDIKNARDALMLALSQSGAASAAKVESRAEAFADAILHPEARSLIESWSHLYLSGLEVFGDAPFEVIPDSSGQPISVRLPISYLPSLALGPILASRGAGAARGGDARVAVFADPAIDAADPKTRDLPRLDLSERTLQGLTGAGFRSVRIIRGEAADQERLEQASADADVLVIVTHGVRPDAAAERPTGLLLSPSGATDGYLMADEIERLPLHHGPLVVLLACGTARGPQRFGDAAATSLAGAFLAAGARGVLVTPIDLLLTHALTIGREFLAAGASGAAPAEALRRARRRLADDGVEPAVWARLHWYGLGG